MLHRAAQKHEQESALAKAASQDFFGSSPPSQSSQKRSSQTINPSFPNPLKPASTSATNSLRSSQQQQRAASGFKRTASGLAKALDGAFEDGPGSKQNPISLGGISPEKGSIVKITENDFVDENEFDSDIDLDIEEPLPKKSGGPSSVPQQPKANSPSTSVIYPTLPRQQQAQTIFSRDFDPTYDTVGPAEADARPESSAPLPWSSSPAEHKAPAFGSSMMKSFAYNPTARTQYVQNGPPLPQLQQKPAKRRTLPWKAQEEEEKQSNQNPTEWSNSTKSKVKSAADATPASKASQKSIYPWNTSASAIKDQQKKHREEFKKTVKKNEADEETLQKVKSSRERPAKVFLSEEQQHVLNLVVEQKKSVFFTGSAGTGKSVLMCEIISSLRRVYKREPDRVAATASTGLAACNVGGVTLHSFAGIGLGKEPVPELVRKIKRNQKAKHRWMRTKVLIVDEVSMVDGDLFDKLEEIARQMRNNGRPFGGIQLVITGDFFQLPPVPDSGRVAKFAFDAATWNTTIEHTIGLHHVFRQKDPSKCIIIGFKLTHANNFTVFAGMLNEMREGRLQQSSINAFRNLSRPLNFEDSLEATELFPTRNEVDNANFTRLNMLQGAAQVFESRDGGAIVDIPQRAKLLQNCMAPENITLKKGAQVMLIKNVDDSLVNGSLGKVIGFMDEKKFDSYTLNGDDNLASPGGTLATQKTSNPDLAPEEAAKRRILDSIVARKQWPVVRFMIADGTTRDLLCQPESWKVELPNGEVQASRNQIPLILAWALSIHKAQGQTLERVKVDLGKVFEKGQAYVALSRATSMGGLQVLRFDPKKVNAHDRVRNFYSNLSRVELAEKDKDDRGGGQGKKKGAMQAGDYEKMFVGDEWD